MAAALETNTALVELHLCKNQVGDGGASGIARALRRNSGLAKLYLSNAQPLLGHNAVSDLGGIDLARSLEKNSTLQILHLDSNKMGQAGVTAMARLRMKELHLGKHQAKH